MKLFYWMHRTLCLVGHPSPILALAVFVYVWFKVGYMDMSSVVPSTLVLLVAFVYRQTIDHLYPKVCKPAYSRRAGSDLS
ncbi:hypothetical protein [Pseudomonas psychrophila]|uniref:Uncharacterized protein n=1 Tax=Pseudomonas psychrophila TaxID=122355 RepID=A0A8I1FX83_9PSED|nr:hypothetical protein [Pseudomonas psychrophila]AVX93373.1 hypothetical protein PkP19E3_35375 [Pseudomonas koreensis]MBJ2258849.1 hypothetical protein [Pseudomonas psychrophila]